MTTNLDINSLNEIKMVGNIAIEETHKSHDMNVDGLTLIISVLNEL